MKRAVIVAASAIVALSAFVSVNHARELSEREGVEKPLKSSSIRSRRSRIIWRW